MKNPRSSLVTRLFFSSFLALTLFTASALASPDAPSTALKYTEEGNWIVQVVRLDHEGFPDTLSRKAYSSEKEADAAIRALNLPRGTLSHESLRGGEPTHELRNREVGEIWEATEVWNLEWEDRFADWTRANFDRDFYKRYKIKTDCADATVALRWIFSRIMKLPAGNRLNYGDALFTNRSVRSTWRDLPAAENWFEDKRFLTALDYVLLNTYTHSVNDDSYPIEINGKWIKPGTFHLELRTEDGHTRVFTRITYDSSEWPLEDMWSNVPRKVRSLEVEPFTVLLQPPMETGGILRHRWTVLEPDSAYLVPGSQMPGYSLEQYQPDFFKHNTADFSVEVAARIVASLDPIVGLNAAIRNLEVAVADRKSIVEVGAQICAKEDCSPGTENYENLSTPSRDARIGQYFEQVASYLTRMTGNDLKRAREVIERERGRRLLKFGGKKRYYREIEAIWVSKKYSSDPRVSQTKRWGF